MMIRSTPRLNALFILIAGLFLATALAGCTAPPPKGPTAKTGTVEIDMENFAFSPKEETIKVGATIKWVNNDSTAHDVTAGDKSWQSDGGDGGIDAGETWEKTFSEAGTFEYYCTLHSPGPGQAMAGKITVVA